MKSGDAYWQIVNQVWKKISIYHGEAVFVEEFMKADIKQRHLFAAHRCQSEVRNGGFHLFFWNSTGILAPEAVMAFGAIGMPNAAALIERAMMFFGSVYPRDRNKRIETLYAYAKQNPKSRDPFDKMNDEFFKLLDEESGGFEAAADRYALLADTEK